MPQANTNNTSPGLRGWITIAVIKCIGALPLSLARALGAFVGWLGWKLNIVAAKVTVENLRIAYPDMEEDALQTLAKDSMVETGRLATEICVIQQRGIEWLKSRIFSIQGEELIRDELEQGKGIIFLAPHLGNWEVLSLTLPTYGNLTALYQPPKQLYLEKLIKSAREKTGATLVPTNRKGVALLLRSLRSGGITAVLPDQNPNKGFGEFAPFYGTPAYTMTTVHGFSQRANCAVVMGFVKRVSGGFETIFLEAPEGIYSEDQAESLVALNKGVELCIEHCPAQYQWEYKRFKNNPDGTRRYSYKKNRRRSKK